jgi:hypothetical protein
MTPERRTQLQFMAAHNGVTPSRVQKLKIAGKETEYQSGTNGSLISLTVGELNFLLAQSPPPVAGCAE